MATFHTVCFTMHGHTQSLSSAPSPRAQLDVLPSGFHGLEQAETAPPVRGVKPHVVGGAVQKPYSGIYNFLSLVLDLSCLVRTRAHIPSGGPPAYLEGVQGVVHKPLSDSGNILLAWLSTGQTHISIYFLGSSLLYFLGPSTVGYIFSLVAELPQRAHPEWRLSGLP